MTELRRLLHIIAGWILGMFTVLAWVWLGEGKASPSTGQAGLHIVLAIVTTVASALLVFSAAIVITVYAIDGADQ